MLLLRILVALRDKSQELAYITTEELVRVVIPLSSCPRTTTDDYVQFLTIFREGNHLDTWPNCCPGANDTRIAREFLLFLRNYGYLVCPDGTPRLEERYHVNTLLIEEIRSILANNDKTSTQQMLETLRAENIPSEVERKRLQGRPRQAQFRRLVLGACEHCVITGMTMPEVLEAAHIKPHRYNGEDTAANGFALRTDIHLLFDTGHLRISPDGTVELSQRARLDYGCAIPRQINIPDFINRDFLRWRWENYNGY